MSLLLLLPSLPTTVSVFLKGSLEGAPPIWLRRARGVALLVFFALLPGCPLPGEPEGTTVSRLEKTAGDNQTGPIGAALPVRPSVTAVDVDGNPVIGVVIEYTVLSGGGSVAGASHVTGDDGVATLESWVLGSTVGQQTLQAAVPGTDVKTTFTATGVAADAKLAIRTQPGGANSGADLAPQPVIEIQNTSGQLITTSTAAVTVAIASGSGSFATGTQLTVNAQAGVATFAGLKINGAGAHTLRFTSGNLTAVVSQSFTIVGAPASLTLGSQLDAIAKGGTMTLAPAVKDVGGATVTSPITYVSRSTGVATVSSTGVVTGVAKGQAVIVASVSSQPTIADSTLVVVTETNGPMLISSIDRFSIKTDTTLTVSIYLDMLTSGKKLGSANIDITWDPARLIYQSNANGGSGVSPTTNATGAATGTFRLALADVQGFSGRVELIRLTFKAGTTVGGTGSLALIAKEVNSTELASPDLLPITVQVSHPIVLR